MLCQHCNTTYSENEHIICPECGFDPETGRHAILNISRHGIKWPKNYSFKNENGIITIRVNNYDFIGIFIPIVLVLGFIGKLVMETSITLSMLCLFLAVAALIAGIVMSFKIIPQSYYEITISSDYIRINKPNCDWATHIRESEEITKENLKQIYCEMIVQKVRTKNGTSEIILYDISAETRNGQTILLLKGIRDFLTAQYIENEIEKILKIKDSHCALEYKGEEKEELIKLPLNSIKEVEKNRNNNYRYNFQTITAMDTPNFIQLQQKMSKTQDIWTILTGISLFIIFLIILNCQIKTSLLPIILIMAALLVYVIVIIITNTVTVTINKYKIHYISQPVFHPNKEFSVPTREVQDIYADNENSVYAIIHKNKKIKLLKAASMSEARQAVYLIKLHLHMYY